MPGKPIQTIGYWRRELEELLSILRENRFQYLLDVGSNPYSSYKPEFSKNALQNFLEQNGFRYLFVGDLLGGLPDDEICYTDGKVDYEKVAERSYFKAGIERLNKDSQQAQRIVLVCSEGKPENCHRSKLTGQTLAAKGIEVLHIDGQNEVISQKDVLLRLSGEQPSLFGDDFFTFMSRKRYRDEGEDGTEYTGIREMPTPRGDRMIERGMLLSDRYSMLWIETCLMINCSSGG